MSSRRDLLMGDLFLPSESLDAGPMGKICRVHPFNDTIRIVLLFTSFTSSEFSNPTMVDAERRVNRNVGGMKWYFPWIGEHKCNIERSRCDDAAVVHFATRCDDRDVVIALTNDVALARKEVSIVAEMTTVDVVGSIRRDAAECEQCPRPDFRNQRVPRLDEVIDRMWTPVGVLISCTGEINEIQVNSRWSTYRIINMCILSIFKHRKYLRTYRGHWYASQIVYTKWSRRQSKCDHQKPDCRRRENCEHFFLHIWCASDFGCWWR